MSWHTVLQAQVITQKSRRTLYRDMASGDLTYRVNAKGYREIETAALLLCYGEQVTDFLGEDNPASRGKKSYSDSLIAEFRLLLHEFAKLKK